MAGNDQLASAKERLELARLRVARWGLYIFFWARTIPALIWVVCGTLGIVSPSLIPHMQYRGEVLLGSGLALLTGKNLVGFLAKTLNSLGGVK